MNETFFTCFLLLSLLGNVGLLLALIGHRKALLTVRDILDRSSREHRAAIRKADRMSQMVRNLHHVAEGD